jgi:hypothetical protein
MPIITLPLPTFRDLPSMGANLTASPIIPSSVATTTATSLPPTLVATFADLTTDSPAPLGSCDSSKAQVTKKTLSQLCRIGEKGALCMPQFIYVFEGAGAAANCGPPEGPAPAGGRPSGLLYHHFLELGAGPRFRHTSAAAGPTHPAPVDPLHWPALLSGCVSFFSYFFIPTSLSLCALYIVLTIYNILLFN